MFTRPLETPAPRTAASIHLGAVVAVCILAALSMPGLPMASSAPKAIRLVGAPETPIPCSERTWPYRGEGCGTRAKESGTPAQSNAPQAQAAGDAAGNPSAELTPLTASGGKVIPGKGPASTAAATAPLTAPVVANTGAPRASTDGVASADEDDEGPSPEPRHKHRHRHHGFFFGFRF